MSPAAIVFSGTSHGGVEAWMQVHTALPRVVFDQLPGEASRSLEGDAWFKSVRVGTVDVTIYTSERPLGEYRPIRHLEVVA